MLLVEAYRSPGKYGNYGSNLHVGYWRNWRSLVCREIVRSLFVYGSAIAFLWGNLEVRSAFLWESVGVARRRHRFCVGRSAIAQTGTIIRRR
ncbi:MAG: hypothetical protein ACR9NN_09385 [Nostochopsis sp.]